MAVSESDRRRCPYCHSTELRRSRARGFERLLRFAHLRPYRCDACDRRFYGRAVESASANEKSTKQAA
jgi:DNA-directed RNA polymerase subunit RPC12/RpoP